MLDTPRLSQFLSRFLALALAAVGLLGCGSPARSAGPGYQIVGDDLEPFRSAFNATSDGVRAVLLVGPT